MHGAICIVPALAFNVLQEQQNTKTSLMSSEKPFIISQCFSSTISKQVKVCGTGNYLDIGAKMSFTKHKIINYEIFFDNTSGKTRII
jgi:hypothetical protein